MAKKNKKAAPQKKIVKAVKKKTAGLITKKVRESDAIQLNDIEEPNIYEPHPLEKGLSPGEKKYLEERIDMCVKAYPKFNREQARDWLLKYNSRTKVI